jgi:hypothetical protein
MTEASWCMRCHHMIVRNGRNGYVHYSDDDWAGPASECGCIADLTRCVPETAAVLTRFARSVSSLASAVASFSATASESAGAWASLASAVKPEEKT